MSEPATLQAAREQAIDTPCRRFADDAISMTELERRLDRARAARTREELRGLLRDLPARTAVPATARSAPSRDRAPRVTGPGVSKRSPSGSAVAVMGGTRRLGKWVPPRSLLSMAIMGGVELDFRDAILEPGSVTSINCFAFWGGIEITVPPDVHVEMGGFALLGGFEQGGEEVGDPAEDAPVIQVNGFSLMAGVEVVVKPRGAKKKKGHEWWNDEW